MTTRRWPTKKGRMGVWPHTALLAFCCTRDDRSRAQRLIRLSQLIMPYRNHDARGNEASFVNRYVCRHCQKMMSIGRLGTGLHSVNLLLFYVLTALVFELAAGTKKGCKPLKL